MRAWLAHYIARLLDLEEALTALERIDADRGRVVELRYLAELSVDETASVLRVSLSSVKRDWIFARTWFRHHLQGGST